jgi:uncharacterized protein YigA (DUF484 family)
MNDQDIAEYLLAHPEFFSRHAELLAKIELSDPHAPHTLSLFARQMQLLRGKNRQLEYRLAQLIHHGQRNGQLAADMHRFTIKLLSISKSHDLIPTMLQSLRDIFDLSHAGVCLWNIATHQEGDASIRLFAQNLVTPYCGTTLPCAAALWPTQRPAASIALLALRDPQGSHSKAFGLLGLGSFDTQHFRADMSTDYLACMGALISILLSTSLTRMDTAEP